MQKLLLNLIYLTLPHKPRKKIKKVPTLIELFRGLALAPLVVTGARQFFIFLSENYRYSKGENQFEDRLVLFAIVCIIFLICSIKEFPKKVVRWDLVWFILMYVLFFMWVFTSKVPWAPYLLVILGIAWIGSFIMLWRKYPKKKNEAETLAISKGGMILPKLVVGPATSNKITPLLGAILANDADLVRTALQEHPEHLNTAYAQNGNTPLHVAALNGQTEIVKLLLEQPGLDTTLKNNEGKTAADLAQEKNFTEIITLLRN